MVEPIAPAHGTSLPLLSRVACRWPRWHWHSSALLIVFRTAWVSDDAFITFRTIDNILHGFGPRWNIDERVQTFTHPLWLLLLTPLVAITGNPYLASIGLSLAAHGSHVRPRRVAVATRSVGGGVRRHGAGRVAGLCRLLDQRTRERAVARTARMAHADRPAPDCRSTARDGRRHGAGPAGDDAHRPAGAWRNARHLVAPAAEKDRWRLPVRFLAARLLGSVLSRVLRCAFSEYRIREARDGHSAVGPHASGRRLPARFTQPRSADAVRDRVRDRRASCGVQTRDVAGIAGTRAVARLRGAHWRRLHGRAVPDGAARRRGLRARAWGSGQNDDRASCTPGCGHRARLCGPDSDASAARWRSATDAGTAVARQRHRGRTGVLLRSHVARHGRWISHRVVSA